LQIDKETLLRRTVHSCARTGLRDLLVITGHGAKHVEAEIENITGTPWARNLRLQCLYNPSYATMNNCYSLLLGLPENNESFIIINSDDVFDSRILQNIVKNGPTVFVVDNVKQLTKESMKVYVEANHIERISKQLDLDSSAGEYIGLARIAAEDTPYLRKSLEEVIANNPDGFYEHGFDIMLGQRQIAPSYTNGLKWTEVDTVEDLIRARELIEKELME
jgi:choline kinase